MVATISLKTAVIYGSVRRERRGINVARFLCRKLEDRRHTVTLVDPLEYELPLLDLMYKEYGRGDAPVGIAAVGRILDEADGFVIVSGEYNHSEPPALKNLLDHYQKEYLFKPSGIVTYSAGPFGGVRALITLRAILAELGTPSIPTTMPVPNVGSAFDEHDNPRDAAYHERVGRFLDEYEWYAYALKHARRQEACESRIPGQQVLCRG